LNIERGMCPEEQVEKLESFIKDMKDEIKQLKKLCYRFGYIQQSQVQVRINILIYGIFLL